MVDCASLNDYELSDLKTKHENSVNWCFNNLDRLWISGKHIKKEIVEKYNNDYEDVKIESN